MTASNGEVSIEEFWPEQTDELVRMWRESFEYGVGIIVALHIK